MRNVWPQPRAECSGNEPRPADSPWLGGWASGVPEPVSLLPNFSPQLLNQRRREDKIPSCVWSSSDYRCLTLTRMHTEHNSWGSQPVEVLVVFQGSFKVHCSFSMGWVLISFPPFPKHFPTCCSLLSFSKWRCADETRQAVFFFSSHIRHLISPPVLWRNALFYRVIYQTISGLMA